MSRFVRTCLLGLPAVVGLAVVACSSSTTRAGFDPGASETADGGSSGSSGENASGGFGGDSSAPTNTDGCSDAAKLVYVLSLEGDLYSFAPADKKFTKVGPVSCKSGNKSFIPISMAVDREAVAWVNMREDNPFATEDLMFKVDTKTAACTPTNIRGPMGGMGFSTNAGTTDKETLFVIGQGSGLGSGLVKVDFANEKFVPIADLTENVDLELTGTGDGRLYAFLQDTPLTLAAMDKASAVYSDKVPLAAVPKPRAPAFAFSFWGGDFYFYTATDTTAAKTTTVSRYRPSDKSLDSAYMTSIGFHVVGAGVSTCAPTSAPK
jgi:hypothetical protein